MVSFTNQALKGVPQTHQVDLLEKYQAVTKEDVLITLRRHFLPLFDSSSSIAVVVTAPSKSEEIGEGLKEAGFEVSQRVMETDPEELEDGEDDSSSGNSDSGSSGN
jgi:Zn-dependent M16 (insulinase) family peptidase